MVLKDEGLNFLIWEQILTGRITFVQVGELKGITFYIYPKEQGHNEPHLHAKYQDSEISISLISFEVIAGNLPSKREKKAIEWVQQPNNLKILRKYWGEFHQEVVV